MSVTCIIVDDEPLAGNLLEEYIGRIPYLKLLIKCTTPLEVLGFLQGQSADLIFLDINMPLLSGIQLAKVLPQRQKVIFTTAHTEYAVESYNVNAVDYLLKPIIFERFIKGVEKAKDLIKNGTSKNSPPIDETRNFFIKSGKAMVKINYNQIHYIEGLKDYVIFQLLGARHIVYKRLKELEEILPSNFVRIHHSFFINSDHVEKIEDNHVHVLDKRIVISAKYKENFNSFIKKRVM